MKASTWERFDKAGTAVSLTCAVHCVAFPFLVGFAPLLAGSFLWGEAFEETMAACSLVIATPALARGYLRHRRLWVPLAFVVGIVFLLALRPFAEGAAHFLFAAGGGFALASGHLLNIRFCRTCPVCRHHDDGEPCSSSNN